MNLGDRLRRGSAYLMSARTFDKVASFLFGVALARILFPADFGMLVTLQIFTGITGFIAGGGMTQALVRFNDVENIHFRIVFTLQMLIGTAIYFLLFFLAPYVAVWFENPMYCDLLRVTALTFFLRPFNNIPVAILSRDFRFKEMSSVRYVRPIATGATSVILALEGQGVWSLIFGGLVGTMSTLPILYWHARWKPVPCFKFSRIKSLGIYGIKFQTNDLLVYLKTVIPNAVISKFIGPAQLGLLNKADSLVTVPLDIFVSSVNQTVFRGMASLQDDLDTCRYLYLKTLTVLSVYVFPIYVFMFWFAEPFIVTVYGSKWQAAAALLQILATAGVVKTLNRAGSTLIGAQNMLGRETFIHIESIAVIGLGCAFFYPKGISWIAFVYLATYSYSCIRITGLASKILSLKIKDLYFALQPSLILNGVLIAVLSMADLVINAMGLHVGNILYIVCLGTIGGAAYLAFFLYIPMPKLAGEVARLRASAIGRYLGRRNTD